jgi:hypothetical protein
MYPARSAQEIREVDECKPLVGGAAVQSWQNTKRAGEEVGSILARGWGGLLGGTGTGIGTETGTAEGGGGEQGEASNDADAIAADAGAAAGAPTMPLSDDAGAREGQLLGESALGPSLGGIWGRMRGGLAAIGDGAKVGLAS